MSFNLMKFEELKEVANKFGVTLPEEKFTRLELLALLAEEGVKYEDYQEIEDAAKEAEKEREESQLELPPVPPKKEFVTNEVSKKVLVKMDRKNFRYDVQGFTFTNEVPYQIMSENEAQDIFDVTDGFRLATPKEVQDFYS